MFHLIRTSEPILNYELAVPQQCEKIMEFFKIIIYDERLIRPVRR